MKSLMAKFLPGIALVAAALLAFAIGNARAQNDRPQTPAQVYSNAVQQAQQTRPDAAPQAAANPQPAAPVQIVYIVTPNPIRWAAAYYGPQYYDSTPICMDPFVGIRVNPIPYPDAYHARRVSSECEPVTMRHFR